MCSHVGVSFFSGLVGRSYKKIGTQIQNSRRFNIAILFQKVQIRENTMEIKEEKVDFDGGGGAGGELLCVVCGDKSTGIHYRVQTCEGCKGFWRRTIQKGMDNEGTGYKCKVFTEACPVNKETRSRCQRCRYLACLRAGMVADLVMPDKERLSRLRLVDQNREKRRVEAGLLSSTNNDKVEQVKYIYTYIMLYIIKCYFIY